MKNSNDKRCVTLSDRRRLGRWLDDETAFSWSKSRCRDNLVFALELPDAVDAHVAPASVVTMHSEVHLSENSRGKQWTVTLVYPDELEMAANGISVLGLRGTALLGRRVGDLIQWDVDHWSRRKVRIDAVHQPELVGASGRESMSNT